LQQQWQPGSSEKNLEESMISLNSAWSSSSIETKQRKALDGDIDAMLDLANCYSNGVKCAKNPKAALMWFENAAKAGSYLGMVNAGQMLLHGRTGLDANKNKACEWFKMAVDKGESKTAMFHLAECYEKGWGVQENVIQALLFYRASAAKGDKRAAAAVARLTGEEMPAAPAPRQRSETVPTPSSRPAASDEHVYVPLASARAAAPSASSSSTTTTTENTYVPLPTGRSGAAVSPAAPSPSPTTTGGGSVSWSVLFPANPDKASATTDECVRALFAFGMRSGLFMSGGRLMHKDDIVALMSEATRELDSDNSGTVTEAKLRRQVRDATLREWLRDFVQRRK
jgi:hypothetical protein